MTTYMPRARLRRWPVISICSYCSCLSSFWCQRLKLVRAVRAKAHDVLQENLVVRLIEPGLIARELQPEAGKLGRRKINHRRAAFGIVLRQSREVGSGQRAGRNQPDIRTTTIQLVVTQSRAPARHELVHALHIPARLA